jgi:uncharacterized protein
VLIKEMTPGECGDFLSRTGFGRLGCTSGGEPYVVPIYFAYEPGYLYSFSTVGQKIEWMRKNPSVCVEADEVANHFQWASVILRGRYEELPDKPEFKEKRVHAQLELEKHKLWWQTAYASEIFRGQGEAIAPIFYCIHINAISGRRAVVESADVKFTELSA